MKQSEGTGEGNKQLLPPRSVTGAAAGAELQGGSTGALAELCGVTGGSDGWSGGDTKISLPLLQEHREPPF